MQRPLPRSTNASDAAGRSHLGRTTRRERALRVALNPVLGCAIALFLRELLVTSSAVLRVSLLFLMHPFASQRRVTDHVSRSLFAATQQPVEE
jgi:hypothetical protein